MKTLTFLAATESETEQLGEILAELLPLGSVVALNGTLGAGKTRLVRAVAEALKVPSELVSSPTFVLVHEYEGTRPLFHFDAYRLKDEDEFLALGPDDYFDRPGLSFIEWADRIEGALPCDRLEISIEVTEESGRCFIFYPIGDFAPSFLTELSDRLTQIMEE